MLSKSIRDHIVRELPPVVRKNLTDRELSEVAWAISYRFFDHGTAGHNAHHVIQKLVEIIVVLNEEVNILAEGEE